VTLMARLGVTEQAPAVGAYGEAETDPAVSESALVLPTLAAPVRALRTPALRNRAVLFELSGLNPGAVFSVHHSGVVIGRALASNIVVKEGGVSWEHAILTNRHDGFYVEDLRSLNGTFLNEARVERPILLADGDQLRLGGSNTVFKFSMMGEFEENVLRNLFALTLRDSLTHLFNHSHFDERLRGELGVAKRQGETSSVLVVDIDHFKTVNARFGHSVGDAVLKLIASTLLKLTRPEDVVARLDGGKFAVVLHATSARNALILGERVCHRVSAISLDPSVRGLVLTASVGLASAGDTEHAEPADALLLRAQQASREANAGGGNRTRIAAPNQ
jgi:diguanylate cyclase (GGDEF)-like protein